MSSRSLFPRHTQPSRATTKPLDSYPTQPWLQDTETTARHQHLSYYCVPRYSSGTMDPRREEAVGHTQMIKTVGSGSSNEGFRCQHPHQPPQEDNLRTVAEQEEALQVFFISVSFYRRSIPKAREVNHAPWPPN